jgi:N-acyl homoserine lactone hydrolase
MFTLSRLLRLAAILVFAVGALGAYLLRGGLRSFEIKPYSVPRSAFHNWTDVLAHPSAIAMGTLQTGVVHMDACLNLDPDSPKQADCDHVPRDLAVLAHWVRHPRLGDFLVDAGFSDAFARNPPYGNYTEAMRLFNWANGITNGQRPGADLAAQLARLNVQPKAVFFTHLHPDHTAGVTALGPQTELIFGRDEASFLARAGVANHFEGKTKFSSIDFSAAPEMAPLGPSVDVFGDGSFWAISAPGHTDDDIAFLINGTPPVLLTGDASHFAWAFQAGVAPRGWNKAGTARGYKSLEQLRGFAQAFPRVKIVYGHQSEAF